jgi:cytochrome P450
LLYLAHIHIGNTELGRIMAGTFVNPLSKFDVASKRKINIYEKLIDDEMMRILERRLNDDTVGEKKDICSLAIEEMKRASGPLTQEDKVSITHQLKTFYFAGHDTTAITISWAIWLLAQNPQVLAKIRAELKGHGVWTESSKPPTYEDLQKCVYLEAAVKETLRLYPPAGGVSRWTNSVDEEWKGYRLSGAYLSLSIYCMGRHPLLWKEPDVFRPDRFLDGSEEPPNSKYGINAKFTAFSKGPRDCIGKYFALLESKLAISALVTRYDVECVDPKERLVTLLTNAPKNGAAVNFRRRDSSAS